eukprot:378328_1
MLSIMSTMLTTFLALFYTVYSIQITTKFGDITGVTVNGINKFLNIPYAQPPVGKLRWRPTEPFKNKWNTSYNATQFGNMCVQPTVGHAMNYDPNRNSPIVYSEDCLYLNIYTSYDFESKSTQSLRHILFWIHGGGLEMDSAMKWTYDGSILAKNQDIIVVAINYRLGRAAWMIDPLLYNSPTGNGGANGFLDMIEALKWTKKHIKSFGGNPYEITIGGESGGGWAVCGLVLSPLAKGLFKRSIQMSGSCIKSSGRFLSKIEGIKQTKTIRDAIGVKSFEELRTMDMQNILDIGYGGNDFIEITNLPSTDGYVFPMNTIDLINSGYINGESVMIGTLFMESFAVEPFYMGSLVKNEKELNEYYYKNYFDSVVSEIQKYYPINDMNKIWKYKSVFNTSSEIIQTTQHTDCWVRCGSITQIDIISNNLITKNNVNVYFYQYGYINEPWDQVTHGYDIGNLFGNGKNSPFSNGIWSDKFANISMKFFGDYVKGIEPINNDNGKYATIQNGYYLRVVDGVKVVDINQLDVVKERCK